MNEDQKREEAEFLKNYDVNQYKHPSVTADVVIFTMDEDAELNVLLIKRGGHPFKDHWAIPGGFLETGKESLEEAAARELFEETGVKVSDGIKLQQLVTMSAPNHDPRTHVVSVVYTALVPRGLLNIKAGDDAKEAKLFKVCKGYDENGDFSTYYSGDNCSATKRNMAFDHYKILDIALKRLQGRLNYTDDAFALLKDKNQFEIFEMRQIHEAILFQKLNNSNFRKMFIRDYVGTGRVEAVGEHAPSGKPKTTLYKYTRQDSMDY